MYCIWAILISDLLELLRPQMNIESSLIIFCRDQKLTWISNKSLDINVIRTYKEQSFFLDSKYLKQLRIDFRKKNDLFSVAGHSFNMSFMKTLIRRNTICLISSITKNCSCWLAIFCRHELLKHKWSLRLLMTASS